MDLFLVVILKPSREKIIIPKKWCENVNLISAFNNGGNRQNKLRKIFFSPNEMKNANFNIEVEEAFDSNADCCYKGYVLYGTGKCFKTKMQLIRINKYFISFAGGS